MVRTATEVSALPDGTVIASTEDCSWPERYAGMRWRKRGDSVTPLKADPYTRETYTALIRFFIDPLPAKVIEVEEA
ncbi:hypothetical protein SEA_QUICKMATH_79 [Mycobacterium phage QuickMath]|uniref:Uncharacterized protein n=1 Tax=Mycobacterium phage QuickMath TaxID=2301570 RepID=A0A385DT75_9CAUD|nr:hypothetical protein I5H83_gp079 [Mycobacterium phage QuickMath]AXQ62008.1 hypothetical protein SEA_QUICKMATH_79 [Mycobacterium phage QuickMath]